MASRESRGVGRRQSKKKIGITLASEDWVLTTQERSLQTRPQSRRVSHNSAPCSSGGGTPQSESGSWVLVSPLPQIHRGVLDIYLHHASVPSSVRKRTSSLVQSRLDHVSCWVYSLLGPTPSGTWELEFLSMLTPTPCMRWGYICSLSALLWLISTKLQTATLLFLPVLECPPDYARQSSRSTIRAPRRKIK